MSGQIGSLNRSLSYPASLQRHSPLISLSDLTSYPLPTFNTNSPHMDSDDSTQTKFHAFFQFINSDIETPDELQDSEVHPLFRNPSFSPLVPNFPMKSPQPLVPILTTLHPFTNDQRSARPI